MLVFLAVCLALSGFGYWSYRGVVPFWKCFAVSLLWPLIVVSFFLKWLYLLIDVRAGFDVSYILELSKEELERLENDD